MDLSTLVVGVIGLVALANKLTDFLKLLTNYATHKTSVITQVIAWGAATGSVFLYSASDFGGGISIEDIALNDMSTATKIILGLGIGSAASVLKDFTKAVDTSDSARILSLNIGSGPPPPA